MKTMQDLQDIIDEIETLGPGADQRPPVEVEQIESNIESRKAEIEMLEVEIDELQEQIEKLEEKQNLWEAAKERHHKWLVLHERLVRTEIDVRLTQYAHPD